MRLDGLRNRVAKVCLALSAVMVVAGVVPEAKASAGNNSVKIVAWYNAAQTNTSEYGRSTIILYNPTTADIDMAGWSIQSGGAGSSFASIYNFYALPLAPTPVLIAHPIIKAGGFYAIAADGLANGATCNTTHCNTLDSFYDAQLGKLGTPTSITDTGLTPAAGVLALANTSASIGTTTCAVAIANTHLIDMVGVESADGITTISCYAGGGPAAYVATPINTSGTNVHGTTYALATIRKNRCVDTFNNYADFTLGYIDFENSTSPAQPCPTGSQMTITAPQAIPENPALSATFTVQAKITPPSGLAIASVKVDTSSLTANTVNTPPTYVSMYDDGSSAHGDYKAGDGIYSAVLTMPSALPSSKAGTLPGVNIVVTDSGGNIMTADVQLGAGGITVPGPGNHDMVITGFYGAGDLTNSQYARDTIILFNPTQNPINLGTYSMQAGGATGTFTSVSYKLPSASVPAGGYFAIAASGTGYGVGLCTGTNCELNYAYDYQLGTIEGGIVQSTQNIISSTATTYALANVQTAAINTGGGVCPLHNQKMADMVGNGALYAALTPVATSTPVSCYPGTDSAHYIPTPYNSATGSTLVNNGVRYPYGVLRGSPCGNQFDEAVDYQTYYLDFENSSTPAHPCAAAQPLMISATGSPNPVGLSDTFVITALVTPASNSTAANTDTVTGDFSILGGSATLPFTLTSQGAAYNTYTATVVPTTTNGFPIGTAGVTLPAGLVTVKDTANNMASSGVSIYLVNGSIVLTNTLTNTNPNTITVKSGGVAVFPLKVQGLHGYAGIVTISCTGSPNTNNQGLPVGMQCITTPPEINMPVNGTTPCQLGISAGTTFSAGLLSPYFFGILLSLLSLMVLGVGIFRRKHLPAALVIAFLTLVTFSTTGCGKDGGDNNTGVAPGTYSFVVTASDSVTSSISSTINLTVIVQ